MIVFLIIVILIIMFTYPVILLKTVKQSNISEKLEIDSYNTIITEIGSINGNITWTQQCPHYATPKDGKCICIHNNSSYYTIGDECRMCPEKSTTDGNGPTIPNTECKCADYSYYIDTRETNPCIKCPIDGINIDTGDLIPLPGAPSTYSCRCPGSQIYYNGKCQYH
jgi:hypothetical protein